MKANKARKPNKKTTPCYSYVGMNLLKSELDYISLYLQVIGKVATVSVKPNKSLLIRNIVARWVSEKEESFPVAMLIENIVTKERAYWMLQKSTITYPDFVEELTLRLKKARISKDFIEQIITLLNATYNE